MQLKIKSFKSYIASYTIYLADDSPLIKRYLLFKHIFNK